MNPYIQYMYSYPHKTAYRRLEGVFLQDYAHLLAGGGHGLYLHIPFCQAKCGYCNLFSVTGQGREAISHYLDAVERQGRQYQGILSDFHPEFSEVAIGGGTPLLLSEGQLERMFGILEKYFVYRIGRGMAVETAPNQTVPEKLGILKQAGATRVSMGIQSFSDTELQALGRGHCARRAREALGLLKSFDFPCVNVDFIYGIPGQTVGSLLDSLKEALAFAPDEIFLYPLYLKHGAWLGRRPVNGQGPTLDPALAYRQYKEASAFLRGEGYRQDSMRRFVRAKLCPGGSVRRNPSVQTKGDSFWVLQKREEQDSSECGFGSLPAPPKRGGSCILQEMEERNFSQSGSGSSPAQEKGDGSWIMQEGEERKFSECGFGSSLALGCGGRSYLGNLHFCTPYAITGQECLEQLQRFADTEDFSQITHGILLSGEEMKRRYVIRHLLIRPGLGLQRYKGHFGRDAREDFPLLQSWAGQGYAQFVHIDGTDYLTLTELGLGLSDRLGPQLISEKVREKMKEWEAAHDF